MLIKFLKLCVLAALSPIWYPIVRELYREVEAALIEEGGLLGSQPTPDELAKLREKYKDYSDPLVSEPWAEARERQERERGSSSGPIQAKAPARRGGF